MASSSDDNWKGKGKNKDAMLEKWKMFLGHLALDVDKWTISRFVENAVGVRPWDVHMQLCQAAKAKGKGKQIKDGMIGLNACFVEFQTLGRL